MNSRLELLQPYPFERLAKLLAGVTPNPERTAISLAIGEPKHPAPECAREALVQALSGLSNYPASRGELALRTTIADWLTRRFKLFKDGIDPERNIIPVAGTREALFAFAQAVVDISQHPGQTRPRIAMPNPGYQIYEGAALLAGATPTYLPCTAENGFRPDLDSLTAAQWDECQLLYLCSPGNPTGAVLPIDYLKQALALAEKHDFVIASDECYSEIYPDENAPPPGLLEAAAASGNTEFKRCMVFHSLSKRSNLPGLRSGFVAGDAELITQFLRYRTYHGCTLAPPTQAASVAAWSDEAHVIENRQRYREKFDAVMPILEPVLDVSRPDGAFYLWPALNVDDETLTRELMARENLKVVPGRYLARDGGSGNPGAQRLRLSLVASTQTCVDAAHRLRRVYEDIAEDIR